MRGFISYSHADIAQCRHLHSLLQPFERRSGIEFWVDDRIRAGQLWDRKIKEAIEGAEVFLLLCSQAWGRTGYIHTDEIPAIQARAATVRGLVIPVILERSDWEDFKQLQVVPTQDGRVKEITNWHRRTDGFAQAAEQIKAAIMERFNPALKALDWSATLATQVQDPAAVTWIKQNNEFVADWAGSHSDVEALNDPDLRSMLDRLHTRAERFAAESTRLDNDPELADMVEAAQLLADTVRAPIETFLSRIKLAYSAIQTLSSVRNMLRRQRDERRNAPDALDATLYQRLDDLVNQAALWIRQFPSARDLDGAVPAIHDLDALIPLAASVLRSAREHGLVPAEDADHVSAWLSVMNPRRPEAARGVASVRNLLYRLGGFATGFVSESLLPGAWEDVPLANTLTQFLRDDQAVVTRFVRRLPDDVTEAFMHLVAVCRRKGLARPPDPPGKPELPDDPPPDFSIAKVKAMILRGETPPQAWVPFVTELSFAPEDRYSGRSEFSDLRPLAALTALQRLDLTFTQVSDVTPPRRAYRPAKP